MFQKAKISHIFVIVIALALGFASLAAVAKSDNAKSSKAEEKKSEKSVNLKNFQEADAAKGQTNAQLHKEKSEEVVKSLKEVAKEEKAAGKAEVSEEIEEVIEGQEDAQEETAEAIEELEEEGKVKTFLVGTDYKNLGQLRSSLAHNTNDIRKLTKSLSGIQTPENQALIQAELETLMQEQQRLRTIIYDKQDDFSLFGWVARMMTGYVPLPAEDPEAAQLTAEVEEAISAAASPVVQ